MLSIVILVFCLVPTMVIISIFSIHDIRLTRIKSSLGFMTMCTIGFRLQMYKAHAYFHVSANEGHALHEELTKNNGTRLIRIKYSLGQA